MTCEQSKIRKLNMHYHYIIIDEASLMSWYDIRHLFSIKC